MRFILYYIGKAFYIINYFYNHMISFYLNEKYYHEIKSIGQCVRFNGISTIDGLKNMTLGNNVHIGNNAHIRASGGLHIGNNTHISRNLVLYTVNHNYNGNLLPYDNTEIQKKVIIEDNVWIGMNVVILPGTHIEEGVIIGAGSIVTGNIKKHSIYGASLAKNINKRDKNHYIKLLKNKKFGGINGNTLPENCRQ